MSSEFSVVVSRLSKRHLIYDKPRDRLLQMLLGRLGKIYYREFWALKDVSLNIKKGSTLGILGKNGAGKSTLLQIVCGTMMPTNGIVQVNGRIAALLELGSGFNPEFTGIDNVFLNGQLIGLSRDEIQDRLQQIIDFADIGDFINQPVKTYSSGMFARLAFSVAVNVTPEILVVDEALSVGDSWFQHKSMSRMRQMMENGCTVIFVSHSIDAVRALCEQAVWMEGGQVLMSGPASEVTNAYMNDVFIENNRRTIAQQASSAKKTDLSLANTNKLPNAHDVAEIAEAASSLKATNLLQINKCLLRNSDGLAVENLHQGEAFTLEFEVEALNEASNISIGFLLKDQYGQDLTGESYFNSKGKSVSLKKGDRLSCSFTSEMLLRGGESYSVALYINNVSKWDRSDNLILHSQDPALTFQVIADVNKPMWFRFRHPFTLSAIIKRS